MAHRWIMGPALVALAVAAGGCSADEPGTAPAAPAPTAAPAIAPVAPAAPAPVEAPTLRITAADGAERRWTEAALKAALGPPRAVEVDSPVYRKRMRYIGYPLAEVLAATAPEGAWTGQLSFRCADGFTPTLPADRVGPLRLFLAVREPDLPDDARWTLLGSTSPAPFYVVGPDKASYQQLPWPFQLESIEAVDFARAYPDAFPRGAAADALRGFERFRSTCFGCHSINLQGGVIGPELNTPVSVLDYWQRPMLEAFLADPASVRARSKMPALGLSEADIADLLAYLAHMKAQREAAAP